MGDLSSGHGCWPPQTALPGNPTVLINFMPVHCAGDMYTFHLCPCKGCIPHPGVGAVGASTVLASFRPVRRFGDALGGLCGGSVAISGSPNVFVGV